MFQLFFPHWLMFFFKQKHQLTGSREVASQQLRWLGPDARGAETETSSRCRLFVHVVRQDMWRAVKDLQGGDSTLSISKFWRWTKHASFGAKTGRWQGSTSRNMQKYMSNSINSFVCVSVCLCLLSYLIFFKFYFVLSTQTQYCYYYYYYNQLHFLYSKQARHFPIWSGPWPAFEGHREDLQGAGMAGWKLSDPQRWIKETQLQHVSLI